MDSSRAERRIVTVSRRILASAEAIFAILTDIEQHTALDGSGMLQGSPRGPERLELGSTFTMGMKQAGAGYRSLNTVVEFEPDRRIAWETVGQWRGRTVVGGQRWRYLLTPDENATTVEHSYVWGYARLAPLVIQLPGFPRRMGPAMEGTLARLEQRVTAA